MSVFEIIMAAISLAMDAMAVAICKGLSGGNMDKDKSITVALYFGGFQAGMPLIGYFIGSSFSQTVESFGYWVSAILLGAIGVNMIVSALKGKEDEGGGLSHKELFIAALATSIDAFALGISFAFLKVNIGPTVMIIGGITFGLTIIGFKLGKYLKQRYRTLAECFGGIVLILLGLNVLLENYGFWG